MNLQNGNTFTIHAKNNSKNNFYIQSTHLNGKVYNNNYIDFDAIQNGGEFNFEMRDTPNKKWASKPENVPYSLSKEKF